MTFSLIFADPAQGVVGGGVQSHYPFVGATVLRVVAGVGASLSQGAGSAALADELLARLGSHQGPSEALRGVLQTCTDQDRRQLGVIGSSGDVAVYTGDRCIDFVGDFTHPGFLVVGNMLSHPNTLSEMAMVFGKSSTTPLAERIVLALDAADKAGGDVRGKQSATLVVRHKMGSWSDIDVRVDDHIDPLGELSRLVKLRRRYEVLDDPAVKAGTPRLDQAVTLAIQERWPEEVQFWLGMLLAQFKRPNAEDVLRPLIAVEPWRTVWLRLQP